VEDGRGTVRLLRRCVGGGEPALMEELVQRLQPRIVGAVRAALRRIGRPVPNQSLEDHVQDVYQHLFERDCLRLRNFRGSNTGKLFAYLELVCAHRVRDAAREAYTQKRHAPIASIDETPAAQREPLAARIPDRRSDPERWSLARDQVEQLLSQLRRLVGGRHRDRDLAIFLHRYRDGMSAQEIARLPYVDVSAAGVDSITSRMMRKLQSVGVGDLG
jgi:RNA polymerase sigma factor (sigma-70 family)